MLSLPFSTTVAAACSDSGCILMVIVIAIALLRKTLNSNIDPCTTRRKDLGGNQVSVPKQLHLLVSSSGHHCIMQSMH